MQYVKEYLKSPFSSKIQELLAKQFLLTDLLLSTLKAGNYIEFSEPIIDKDGYDLIVDDSTTIRKYQLKSKIHGAKTANWQIDKEIILPSHENAIRLGFSDDFNTCGIDGGVIKIELNCEDDENVFARYWYTDAYVMKCFSEGVVIHKFADAAKTANNIYTRMAGAFSDKLTVSSSVFLEATCADSLLWLMGFKSQCSTFLFREKLLEVVRKKAISIKHFQTDLINNCLNVKSN